MTAGRILPLALGLVLALLASRSAAGPADSPLPRAVLVPVAGGFASPTDVAVRAGQEGDDIYVVEQAGRIRLLPGGGAAPSTFLDITDRVIFSGEQGLLGLVFDPENEAYFYVNYTTDLGGQLASRISRFEIDGSGAVASPGSELVILEVEQPYSNHNGGDLAFGPDGYLYIALGDGGSGGDPHDHGQNADSLLGKILRLDVSSAGPGMPYNVPPDNPFVGVANARDEIWALGLRNPWRFSFDRATGDMAIADVGQNRYEEVNVQSGGGKGANYGWRCYEGNEPYDTSGCQPPANYVSPVHAYPHPADGCASVTGGFVYRGAAIPELTGFYVFSDWCLRDLWALDPDQDWHRLTLGHYASERLTAFGEDPQGELYAVSGSSGRLLKLVSISDWERTYLPLIAASAGQP
jgi:glucose/arabinose dehydrogenase